MRGREKKKTSMPSYLGLWRHEAAQNQVILSYWTALRTNYWFRKKKLQRDRKQKQMYFFPNPFHCNAIYRRFIHCQHGIGNENRVKKRPTIEGQFVQVAFYSTQSLAIKPFWLVARVLTGSFELVWIQWTFTSVSYKLYHNSNTTYISDAIKCITFCQTIVWMSQIHPSNSIWPRLCINVRFNVQQNWSNL